MQATDSTSSDIAAGGDIVARAGSYYRKARYFMAAMLLFGGVYFLYDGYKGYPEHNTKVAEIKRQIGEADAGGDRDKAADLNVKLASMGKEHSDFDIGVQKKLGFALLPVALALLAWMLYRSRGEYRLSGQTLHAPGHPPVLLSEITNVDSTLWKRKGIAALDYKTAAGQSGTINLDDFVYDRKPTDAIYARVAPEAAAANAEAEA